VPVPEDQLPLVLPDDVEWRSGGENPLVLHPSWKHAACPRCGNDGIRETDTMDTFMCSSWYHYRYLSPHYDAAPWDPVEYDYWMPVDIYTGGREHANMHLIYTRFFTKALRDMGLVPHGEPMIELHNQGIILGEDSEKMSKSRGNVVAPDDLVSRYGADCVRTYLMFFARWDQGGPWSSRGIEGAVRWLQRVWTLVTATEESAGRGEEARDRAAERSLRRLTHQVIGRVTDDFERFEFNTIVSSLMELTNTLYKQRGALEGTRVWDEAVHALLKLMAPIAPHISEELWSRRGLPFSVHRQSWPEYDADLAAEDVITLIVQIDGKVRERVSLPANVTEANAKAAALATPAVARRLVDEAPRKVVYVPGRLVNVVF
jgi:leucyl-tRNA synthetase